MSIKSSILVLFLLIFQKLIKNVSPRIYVYLWMIVSISFLLPINFSNVRKGLSLALSAENSDFSSELSIALNGYASNFKSILSIVWLSGIIVFSLVICFQYSRLALYIRKISKIQHSHILSTKRIETPFVFGFIRPYIVVPEGVSVKEEKYIIAHEKTHIRHWDSWIKLLFSVVLILHWFNPIAWFFWIVSCRDIEMACDHFTMKELNEMERKEYIQTLLRISCFQQNRSEKFGLSYFSSKKFLKERINFLFSRKKNRVITIIVTVLVIFSGIMLVNLVPNFKSDYMLISDMLKDERMNQVFLISDPSIAIDAMYQDSSTLKILVSRPGSLSSIDAYIELLDKKVDSDSASIELQRDELIEVKKWIMKKKEGSE